MFLTLHVGYGTFKPVRTEKISEHHIEKEWYSIPPSTMEVISRTRREGGRILTVGTTTTRALETISLSQSFTGWTDLFIYPPYRFRIADMILTNFHLPRTTLLMLVAAFAGKELILRAYKEAVMRKYRFYSYGDAMLII